MTAAETAMPRLQLGDTVYDRASQDLRDKNGQPIALRKQSLSVLSELAAHNGQVVDRDDLIGAVWKGRSVSDDALVQCIKDIRAALNDQGRTFLRTAIGRGYSLHGVEEIRVDPGRPPRLLIAPLRAGRGDPALRDLAEIIREDIIVALSARAGLSITSDVRQRGGADYVLEGRVAASGGGVRVFIQLNKGQSEDVAFTETWNATASQAADLPREITEKVGSLLRIHMFNEDGAEHLHRDNAQLDTQSLMAKAAYHMSRIQMQNRDIARDALSVALEREPENAMVLAMRASAAVLSILQEPRSKLPDSPDYCMALADRAMGLAPHIDFVNRARGSLRLWFNGDHAGARADCERALEITPVFHLAHQTIALSEILSGAHEAGIERVKKIIDLGRTTNPRYPHYLAMLSLGHLMAGAFDAGLNAASEAHARAPSDPWCNYLFAAAAGDRRSVTQTDAFQRMVASIDLPLDHFRELAFTDTRDVEMLEDRLLKAGLRRSA